MVKGKEGFSLFFLKSELDYCSLIWGIDFYLKFWYIIITERERERNAFSMQSAHDAEEPLGTHAVLLFSSKKLRRGGEHYTSDVPRHFFPKKELDYFSLIVRIDIFSRI